MCLTIVGQRLRTNARRTIVSIIYKKVSLVAVYIIKNNPTVVTFCGIFEGDRHQV
jgi:hypothetical protein